MLWSVWTEMFSVGVWSHCSQCQHVASEMAGCSTCVVCLWQNSCHRSCCVFLQSYIIALAGLPEWKVIKNLWSTGRRHEGFFWLFARFFATMSISFAFCLVFVCSVLVVGTRAIDCLESRGVRLAKNDFDSVLQKKLQFSVRFRFY